MKIPEIIMLVMVNNRSLKAVSSNSGYIIEDQCGKNSGIE